jgi:GNAT superfamily N-acetyltransferase
VRFGGPGDVGEILALVRELAVYEKLADQVSADEVSLQNNLFGERRVAEVVLAYERERCAGFALFFHNFSTFLGKPGLYLEDLFVRPAFRGRGYGKALMVFRAAPHRACAGSAGAAAGRYRRQRKVLSVGTVQKGSAARKMNVTEKPRPTR